MFSLFSDFLTDYQLTGVAIGVATFLVIGLFHPIVIKSEYYFGVRCWWFFALCGLIFTLISLNVKDIFLSTLSAVVGASSFWSIKEIFEQRERVRKGWFPKRMKRKDSL